MTLLEHAKLMVDLAEIQMNYTSEVRHDPCTLCPKEELAEIRERLKKDPDARSGIKPIEGSDDAFKMLDSYEPMMLDSGNIKMVDCNDGDETDITKYIKLPSDKEY